MGVSTATALLAGLLLLLSLAPGALATFVDGFVGADSAGAMQQVVAASVLVGVGGMLVALLAGLLALAGIRPS
jgi:hypothetical protein